MPALLKSQSVLYSILSGVNGHDRDQYLEFDEPTHKYTITNDPDSNYTSVTTFNHKQFPQFDADAIIAKMMKGRNWNPKHKYWGKSPQEIKDGWSKSGAEASGAGTDMHFDIECFMNQEVVDEDDKPIRYTHEELLKFYDEEIMNGIPPPNLSVEWQYFLQFARAFPELKPYRTEWMVYHEELKLAGSIDMVYENPDGSLSIYDWKRSKEISKTNGFKKYALNPCIDYLPDTNYWHYSLQLNTYKAILESKYGKKVTDLYLVRLHPNNEYKTFQLIKCVDMSNEVADLFAFRKQELLDEKVSPNNDPI